MIALERPRLRRIVRAPLTHFFLAGSAMFVVERSSSGRMELRTPRRAPIVFTAPEVERLRAEWTRERGEPVRPEDEPVWLEKAIDDEVLFREAIAQGFDGESRAVRARLAEIGRSLEPGSEDAEASAGVSRRLGFVNDDRLIRRHLIELMRLALQRAAAAGAADETEARRYYETHASEFAQPARVRFTHVFFSRDRRGLQTQRDAVATLHELRDHAVGRESRVGRRGAGAEDPGLGDPFLRAPAAIDASSDRLERLFGPGFEAALARAPAGEWFGPIPSAYGLHLVKVHQRAEPAPLGFEAVRRQIESRFGRERGDRRYGDLMRRLRERYIGAEMLPSASRSLIVQAGAVAGEAQTGAGDAQRWPGTPRPGG
jgi:hypothetical protein